MQRVNLEVDINEHWKTA